MNSPYSSYEPPLDRLLLTPEDPDAPATRRQAALSWGSATRPGPSSTRSRTGWPWRLDAPYAMVNFIDESRQFFAGLYTPDAGPVNIAQGQAAETSMSRVMRLDHGFCPHIVVAAARRWCSTTSATTRGSRATRSSTRSASAPTGRAADRPHGDRPRHDLCRRHRLPSLGAAAAGDHQAHGAGDVRPDPGHRLRPLKPGRAPPPVRWVEGKRAAGHPAHESRGHDVVSAVLRVPGRGGRAAVRSVPRVPGGTSRRPISAGDREREVPASRSEDRWCARLPRAPAVLRRVRRRERPAPDRFTGRPQTSSPTGTASGSRRSTCGVRTRSARRSDHWPLFSPSANSPSRRPWMSEVPAGAKMWRASRR